MVFLPQIHRGTCNSMSHWNSTKETSTTDSGCSGQPKVELFYKSAVWWVSPKRLCGKWHVAGYMIQVYNEDGARSTLLPWLSGWTFISQKDSHHGMDDHRPHLSHVTVNVTWPWHKKRFTNSWYMCLNWFWDLTIKLKIPSGKSSTKNMVQTCHTQRVTCLPWSILDYSSFWFQLCWFIVHSYSRDVDSMP